MTSLEKVNSPIQIGSLTIRNRLTMAPTVKFGYTDDSGLANEKYTEHYRARAHAGCGLVCVEATAVVPEGRFCRIHMGLWSDEQIEGHKRITEACHQEGAAVIIQLNHAGYCSGSDCGKPAGPSVIRMPSHGKSPEIETVSMTIDQIHQVQEAFADAAVRAKKAGYDGVQLHGCHTYMINQFASPRANFRVDEYGGTVEKRCRFGNEIIRKIRSRCGEDFLISVRIAGGDPDIEEGIAIGEQYVEAGCDYLQVSTGFETNPDLTLDEDVPYNRCVWYGIKFHEHFSRRSGKKIPVSVVNGIYTPELIYYLLDHDLTDTVDIGRAALADPGFFEAVLKGGSYQKCFVCKSGCKYGPFANSGCPAAALRKKNSLK